MEEKKIVIRPLCPDLCEDWLWFFDKTAFQCHGTSKMYERSGFAQVADLKYVKVMRKRLGQ